MDLVHQSGNIFAAQHIPFPEFFTGTAVSIQPQQGVIDMDPAQQLPKSISVEMSVSCGPVFQNIRPAPPAPPPQLPQTSTTYEGYNVGPPRTM